MGALAPLVSAWIPEDDLLLKNAIEAGASLESLAKGAVQFSREFTVRELQARWHSLLYDPVISEEASSRIIEFKHYASALSTGNLKDDRSLCEKRKSESVRNCYYAKRIRIRNGPFNSMDSSFLVAPNGSNFVGIEDKPLPGNPISDDLVVQETNVDCSFLQIQESPHVLGENQFLLESEEFPVNSLFQDNDLILEPSFSSDQINNDPENIFFEFEGNQVFTNSPIVESEWSIWRTDEGLSASAIPADDGHGENGLYGGDLYALPSDGLAKTNHASGPNAVTDSNIELEMPCEASANLTADTDGYLMEITNSLMNDEPYFLDIDNVKDVLDKSFFDGLSSLLENSPKASDRDQIIEAMTVETQDNIGKVSCLSLEESDGSCTPKASDQDQMTEAMTIGTQNILAKGSCSDLGECTLNSEEPEIPCNDDVVLPKKLRPLVVSSTVQKKPGNPLSACVKDFSRGQKANEVGAFLNQRDKKIARQSHGSSQMKGSNMTPEVGHLHPVVKCEDSPSVSPGGDRFLSNGTGQSNSIGAREGTFHPTLPMEKSEENTLGKHMNHSSAHSLIGKPALCSDSHSSSLVNSSAVKQEVDALQISKDYQASTAALESIDIIPPEPVVDHPPSEAADLHIESDDDVPCYSDIEAMVCDQDRLDPYDQDLYDQEVARYEDEDSKRALIRLEQTNHSYMQRAIASHGALAILYGRHDKHYIKKPEILVGRTTEDLIVDIDLGRKGGDFTVSRRQAIINMEEDGSFHLKNIGKCPVSINGDPVAPGRRLSLKSGCVILIKGMALNFEINQTCVEQYLKGLAEQKLSSRAPC